MGVNIRKIKIRAEIRSGMSYPTGELIYNRGKDGILMQESISAAGNIAYFEGGALKAGVTEANQWLDAIMNETEPFMKPEQAFKVTQILDNI